MTPAGTLRKALEDSLALNPRLRGQVPDDQGHARADVVIFVDGRRSTDRDPWQTVSHQLPPTLLAAVSRQ